MLANLLFGAALFAQAGSLAVVDEPAGLEQHDVAYEALASGEARSAVTALEALRGENPGDPALLINLGSAYAELGQLDRAEACFREAADSTVRYQLELADGSWVDSRRAARTALLNLEQARMALN
jgi:Flp pilus assembly protein TadD